MNTGPITEVAAKIPITGHRGPSHACTILTRVPLSAGVKLHSTSIPFVIPPTCRNRIAGVAWSTSISDNHHVGQPMIPNGR